MMFVIYNCSWCGPRLPDGEELQEETVCDACMILWEAGWRYERERYFSNGKEMHMSKYIDRNGKQVLSAKLFLEQSSISVVNKLSMEVNDIIADSDGEEEDSIPSARSVYEIRDKGLPGFPDLVASEWGLYGVLKTDNLCVLNLCYGSDVTIAFLVLNQFTKPKFSLPSQVETESKFNL